MEALPASGDGDIPHMPLLKLEKEGGAPAAIALSRAAKTMYNVHATKEDEERDSGEQQQPHVKKEPPQLTLLVGEIELEKLHKIDIANQCFSATLWVPFTVKRAANDPYLSAEGDGFPIGEDGKPTFRPPLGWFVKQVDFRNAVSFKVIDSKILKRGDDLVMLTRVDGVFCEVFELADYPFDCQGLTMSLNINCRINGPMKVAIELDPNINVTMTCITFVPPERQWRVEPWLHIHTRNVGTGDRSFPAVSFTARVTRNPFYHLIYLAAPFGIFALLAVLTGLTRELKALESRSKLALTLVLTASTYRIAISNKLPPINYLTSLDYYTLINWLIIIFEALDARFLILMTENGHLHADGETMTGDEDLYTSYALIAVWVGVHAWLLYLIFTRGVEARIVDKNLKHPVYRDKEYDSPQQAPEENAGLDML